MGIRYPDFAQCRVAALEVLNSISQGKLCYGIYTPLSDKKRWDERWIKDGAQSFLHWWVETSKNIIDTGSAQFGEESYKVLPKEDKRYKKVGYEEYGIRIPIVKDVSIVWETLEAEKTVKISWPRYDEYLAELGVWNARTR